MSDSGSPIGGTFETINEAVVQPVKDEVGQAIEAGIQSVVGGSKPQTQQSSQIKPGEQPKTQITEQKGLAEARRKIKWWQDLAEAQRKVREQEKQKLPQRQQQAQQGSQQQAQIEQFEEAKKQKEINPQIAAATGKTEMKKGVGG